MTPTDPEQIVSSTRRWLERAVIGLNLCPFAKAVHGKGQIRYAVSDATFGRAVLEDLKHELARLVETDERDLDTTLLIVPHALRDFFEYKEVLGRAEKTLRRAGLEGVVQIASFHPNYRFADCAPDDIENYTNRAPYPILHLLREASVARAVEAIPDAARIYERNQETMRALGHAGWRALFGHEGLND